MSEALIIALIQLAARAPALYKEIRDLARGKGVTDEQWERTKEIIAKDPASYSGPWRDEPEPPTPTVPPEEPAGNPYEKFLTEEQLEAVEGDLLYGDVIWRVEESDGTYSFWIVSASARRAAMPPRATQYRRVE